MSGQKSTMRKPKVAIIGAGMSGILTAIKFQGAGITDFTIYEKAGRLGGTWRDNINHHSYRVLEACYLEPALAEAEAGANCQFERLGYFCADSKDHTAEKPVFNRTVTLRDTWARMQKQQGKK